MVENNQLFNT